MTCKNYSEEMTKIRDHGKIGYVCLHCGDSFLDQITMEDYLNGYV